MIHALHGNFGLPSDWDAALPPGVPAKAWHLWEIRRHHPETHTLTGFAAWFNHQIATLPPDPCRVLAGYSLGGRLALHVLADRPRLWHRACLLSTHPGLDRPAARHERLAHDLTWQIRCLEEPWPGVCAAWNAQSVLQSHGPPPDLAALEPWREEIAGAFDGWSLGRQAAFPGQLGDLSPPGVWLTGAGDPKFSALAVSAAIQMPTWGVEAIPHAGHRLLHDAPEQIIPRLSGLWLDGQVAG